MKFLIAACLCFTIQVFAQNVNWPYNTEVADVPIVAYKCAKNGTSQIALFMKGVRSVHLFSDEMCEKYEEMGLGNPGPCAVVHASIEMQGLSQHPESESMQVLKMENFRIQQNSCL